MIPALDSRALKYACQRVEDFALVNRVRPPREKEEAADLWLDHLGLDEALRVQLDQWLDRFYPDWDGQFLIGLALGLLVNQWNLDHPRS